MSRGKKIVLWLAAVVALLVVAGVAVLLARNSLLRAYVVREIRQETGAEARIGKVNLDLAQGSVQVRDFVLENPPGFGDEPLLRMPELYLRLDREVAGERTLRLDEARVHVSELRIVRNAAGETNLLALQEQAKARAKRKPRGPKEELRFGGIGELRVTLGTVRYVDLQNPTNSHEFALGVQDEVVRTIKTEEDLETWAKAVFVRITIQQLLQQSRADRQKLRELLERKPQNTPGDSGAP